MDEEQDPQVHRTGMHFSLSHAATPAIDSSALVAVLSTPVASTVRPLEKIQHTGNFYFLLRGCEEERLSSPSLRGYDVLLLSALQKCGQKCIPLVVKGTSAIEIKN